MVYIYRYAKDVFFSSLRPALVSVYLGGLFILLIFYGIYKLTNPTPLTAQEITEGAQECKAAGLEPRLVRHFNQYAWAVACEIDKEGN